MDGGPRTSTSTFTQLPSSVHASSKCVRYVTGVWDVWDMWRVCGTCEICDGCVGRVRYVTGVWDRSGVFVIYVTVVLGMSQQFRASYGCLHSTTCVILQYPCHVFELCVSKHIKGSKELLWRMVLWTVLLVTTVYIHLVVVLVLTLFLVVVFPWLEK